MGQLGCGVWRSGIRVGTADHVPALLAAGFHRAQPGVDEEAGGFDRPSPCEYNCCTYQKWLATPLCGEFPEGNQ